MAEHGTQSLQVLSEEVRAEREAQRRHFDALDSKAGVMLGFAGALAALALRALRDGYLSADPRFTLLTLLDSHVVSMEALGRALHRKARRLKLAMSAVAAAAFLIAAGSALH